MKRSAALNTLPVPVQRALVKLGADLNIARRRRRITMDLLAERAFITRKTLARVERGDAGVSIGIYATVLFTLGMADRLGDLVAPSSDELGMTLQDDRLPKRIRTPRRKNPDDGPRRAPALPRTRDRRLGPRTTRTREVGRSHRPA